MTKTYALDFEELKRTVSFEQVVPYTGLPLKRVNDNQFKGDCPFCKARNSLTVTIAPTNPKYATGAFHCFVPSCRAGGDQIEFLSRVRGNPRRSKEGTIAAAKELSEQFRTVRTVPPAENSSPTVPKSNGCPVLDYLKPEDERVQGLGVDAETAAEWQSGFAPQGVMRGFYAVPVKGNGKLLAYVGIAVAEDQPALHFYKGFDRKSV
jgi:DNA primase